MKLSFLLIVTALIHKSIEDCLLENVQSQFSQVPYGRFPPSSFGRFYSHPSSFRGIRPSGYGFLKKYIKCYNETINQDFRKKIDQFLNDSRILWLEINNVDSVKLEADVFSLGKIQDLRINEGKIEIIEIGAFNGLANLSKLLLKNNKIRNLCANCFFNLTNLVEIDLSANRIDNIDDKAFDILSSLIKVNISHNSITILTNQVFKSLTNVDSLDLSYNRISQLDSNAFKNFKTLKDLDLKNNHLTRINANLLAYNYKLENLDISYNFLIELNNIIFPKNLITVKITNNYIKTIQFVSFTQIKILDLSRNEITLSNNSFKNIAVSELYFENNFIGKSNRIDVLSNLTTLEIISLKNNQINVLSQSMFANNTFLKEVNLANNYLYNLTKFPISLEILNVSNNFLNSSTSLNYLINLKDLDLSFNRLKLISFHFFDNLKFLASLKLQNNKIRKIDIGSFRDTKFLKELDLSNNNVSVLEIGTFAGIDSLIILDISHNQLNVISDGIFHNLKSLQLINVAFNNISFISVENTLSHLYWLREINLAGNHWSCSFLTMLIKDFKKIKLVEGNEYSVTNVNGIACQNKIQNTTNVSITDYTFVNVIASKQATTNSLLIIILIVLIIKLLLKYCKKILKPRRKCNVRNSREDEHGLIDINNQ